MLADVDTSQCFLHRGYSPTDPDVSAIDGATRLVEALSKRALEMSDTSSAIGSATTVIDFVLLNRRNELRSLTFSLCKDEDDGKAPVDALRRGIEAYGPGYGICASVANVLVDCADRLSYTEVVHHLQERSCFQRASQVMLHEKDAIKSAFFEHGGSGRDGKVSLRTVAESIAKGEAPVRHDAQELARILQPSVLFFGEQDDLDVITCWPEFYDLVIRKVTYNRWMASLVGERYS